MSTPVTVTNKLEEELHVWFPSGVLSEGVRGSVGPGRFVTTRFLLPPKGLYVFRMKEGEGGQKALELVMPMMTWGGMGELKFKVDITPEWIQAWTEKVETREKFEELLGAWVAKHKLFTTV